MENEVKQEQKAIPVTEEIASHAHTHIGDLIVDGKIRSTSLEGVGVINHDDPDASAYLSFFENADTETVARVRLRGDGVGANGPFQIQGPSDAVRMSVEKDGTIINGTLEVTDKITASEFVGNLRGSLMGSVEAATTATRLQNPRNISLAGGVTGSASFDGTANAVINATIVPSGHQHAIAQITNLQTELNNRAPSVHTHTWESITGRPNIFAPSAHTHNANDVNAGVLNIARIPTGTTSATVSLGNHTHTLAQLGAAAATHTHTIAQVTGLQAELNNRAPSAHTHTWESITERPDTFTPSAHTHNASDINVGTLAISRIPTGTTNTTVSLGNHTHTPAQLGAAAATHTHNANDVNAGVLNIARIPTGTTNATVSLGNHTHTLAQLGAAAASHTHSANDINAGTLNIARIPTGTTNATVSLGNHTHTPAQLGAAAASHTHTIAQVTGLQAHLDDNIRHTTRLSQNAFTSIIDINQYPVGRSSFSVANMPAGHGWPANTGTVETEWINLDRITQVFTDATHTNPTRWYRIGHQESPNTGRWSGWQQLASQRNLPQPATTAPVATSATVGIIGNSAQFARADHVHPAGTATRLQTARMINGTSFNGTEGITTAHWGQARTITLSGAVTGSVSINGSQNVTINTAQGRMAHIDGIDIHLDKFHQFIYEKLIDKKELLKYVQENEKKS